MQFRSALRQYQRGEYQRGEYQCSVFSVQHDRHCQQQRHQAYHLATCDTPLSCCLHDATYSHYAFSNYMHYSNTTCTTSQRSQQP